MSVAVIGGGLAGAEAAWQAARYGIEVDLFEMRPQKSGPAHVTGTLAELVCSNSFRGAELHNAVGLLKAELALLDSVIVSSAHDAAVPAGGALAVDRGRFSELVQRRILDHPRITVHRQEVRNIPLDRPVIIACGPLPSADLTTAIDALIGARMHYYDAASPIVAADSLDERPMFRKSRYDKGDGDDYLNVPLNEEEYGTLLHDLRSLPRHVPKAFELDDTPKYFEGCLPIEAMADRGDDVLRFGPLKPVGLRDPRTGKTPYAVVQLRAENAQRTAYNLVGFQTQLTWPSQKVAFGKLPGFADAEWVRLGVMHRNTFIDSPRLLDGRLRLRTRESIYFAGQITGAEGYVEAAACGAIAGIDAARTVLDLPALPVPPQTALGALVAHLQNRHTPDFQPSNVNWGAFTSLPSFDRLRMTNDRLRMTKREKRRVLAEQALRAVAAWRESLGLQPVASTAGKEREHEDTLDHHPCGAA